jgi:flagellar protein FliL
MKAKVLMLAAIVMALFVGGMTTAWMVGAGPFAKHHPAAAKLAHQIDDVPMATADSRFVTLDKVIVMLNEPEAMRSRYLALDLVFQTNVKNEKQVKDQLPLLRSTTYRALSPYNIAEIRGMDVDQLTTVLEGAYAKVYGGAGAMPFSSVQVGKQMLE